MAEVDTTLILPASKAAEIEMAVEKAVPTTPESMLTVTWPSLKRRECMEGVDGGHFAQGTSFTD